MIEVEELKRRVQEAGAGDVPELVELLREQLGLRRRDGTDAQAEYQVLWLLLPLARRTGKLPDYRNELDRALDLADGRTEEAVALASLRAELEAQEGRYDDAETTLRQCLKLAGSMDEARKGSLILKLARVQVHREQYAVAARLLAEVLPVLEEGGHAALAATCRFHLGNISLRQGRFAASSSHHRQALAVRKGLGDPEALSASLCALGAVSLASGNYPQALEWFRQAETTARNTDSQADLAYALYGLGRALGRLGDAAGATRRLRASLEIRRAIGDQEGQAISQVAVAENSLALGQPRKALEEAQEAVFHLSLLAPSGTVGDAEQLLGRIHLAQRHDREARRHLDAALRHHETHHDPTAMAFDRAWMLRLKLAWPVREEIEPLVDAVLGYLETHAYPDLGERLDYQVFAALEALAAKGERGGRVDERNRFLERAYAALMRKTNYLDAELRHRFLFQVPENDAILQAAGERDIGEAVGER